MTGKRTFRKFFTQEELRQWIEQAVGRRPVAAAPGIFYVFRDEGDAPVVRREPRLQAAAHP